LLDRFVQIATRLRGYNPLEVLIELAVIWVVVFVIWSFLKGTRGARVLRGFGLVVIVAGLIVAALGAEGQSFAQLRYLLNIFLTFSAVALVIVFQPELRRALVRIGEARLFRSTPVELEPVVDQVIAAVEYLAKNKIGAIVAIEREVSLEGIVEAGTPLHADVTAELLKTIFWPGSALHDMGVIIRGDKIASAGVQFPLAEGDELAQELGSRHRAAVGLSNEADCLVIVVSEETGAISLAERGNLLRKLSPDGLRAMIRRGLAQAPPAAADDHAGDSTGESLADADEEGRARRAERAA
jgi:diadenylate cyclase